MGSFFGGLLAEKGLDVVLIDVWQVVTIIIIIKTITTITTTIINIITTIMIHNSNNFPTGTC